MPETVVVLGASPKPERYAFKAQSLLKEHGHTVIPVNPRETEIEGIPCVASLADIHEKVDTVTVYVGPAILETLVDPLIQLQPGRVILNPGTEDPDVQALLAEAGVAVEEACTLVLLKTGQY